MTTISDKWTTFPRFWFDGSFRDEIPVISVGFGLFDAKGREVGCGAAIESHHVWNTETAKNEPDGRFMYVLSTRRNGEVFGASLGGSRETFATVEEAKIAAEAAIERSRKAASKKYGTTPAEVETKAAEQAKKRDEARARKIERNRAAWAADKARAEAERAES